MKEIIKEDRKEKLEWSAPKLTVLPVGANTLGQASNPSGNSDVQGYS